MLSLPRPKEDAVQFPKKKSVSASAGTKKGAGVSVITTVALILGTMTMCVQGSSHSRHGNPSAPISFVEKGPMGLISLVMVMAVGLAAAAAAPATATNVFKTKKKNYQRKIYIRTQSLSPQQIC